MEVRKVDSDFTSKLQKEIIHIRSYLFSKIDQIQKEKFIKLEKYYDSIVQQIQSKEITEEECTLIYGQYLKTLKRFKRNCENHIKFNERDIDAFRKRHEATGQQFLPIFHDIKMNIIDRMNKFDINKVSDPNFQHHLYTNKELCEIGFQIFEHQGYYKELKIEPKMIQSLIKEICLNYNITSYHNFTHAFSLFQMLFCLSQQPEIKEFLQPFEIFSGFIAGLGHDLNHKGLNNLYKQKKKAQKSIMYCESGILENMHSAYLFGLMLRNQEIDIFSKITDQTQQNTFKRLLQSCILATDMGKHSKIVDRVQKKTAASIKFKTNPNSCNDFEKFLVYKKDFADDRKFVLNVLTHACDIGNPCYTFNNYMNWSMLLSQEFHDQTLKEERLGLPVTTTLKYKDKIGFYNGQTFFSKVLVLPLWKGITDYFQTLLPYSQAIEKNLQKIEEEKQKLQGQVAK